MKLIAICLAMIGFVSTFECSRVLTDFRDDDQILEELKKSQAQTGIKGVSMQCIQNLIEGNHFESANFAI